MLTFEPLRGIPDIQPGDDLAEIILESAARAGISFASNDILVLAQKIVSKAEGRIIDLANVHPSPEAVDLALKTEKDARVVELILQESVQVVRSRPGLIIVEHRLGFICANAGIDHSNVQDWDKSERVLLLPENPDASAQSLSDKISLATGTRIGVAIADSHGRAWRVGTTGVAIGLANVPAIVDMRGKPDRYGREMLVTQIGAADELAAGASLIMGQGAEGTPVIHVRGFPFPLRKSKLDELIRAKESDLFR